MSFDPERVYELMVDYLHSAADVWTVEGKHRIWAFPRQTGTPVLVSIDDDEADVFAGFAFRTTLGAAEPGQEESIIDCVEAVVNGRAYEYYNFLDEEANSLAIDDRSYATVAFAYEGREGASHGYPSPGSFRYTIPAWESIPERISYDDSEPSITWQVTREPKLKRKWRKR